MMDHYKQIAFQVPPDAQKYTIKSGKNVLVIREPFAADFLLSESIKDRPNMHERTFILAERLCVSWNGQPGVGITEIGMLTRQAYKELMNYVTRFNLDIMPDAGREALSQLIEQTSTESDNGAKVS